MTNRLLGRRTSHIVLQRARRVRNAAVAPILQDGRLHCRWEPSDAMRTLVAPVCVDRMRAPGSVGAGSTPGRIFKGMRMAGRMGNEQVTASNLTVALVDAEKNILAVKGSVPGGKNGLLIIREARKA